VAACGGGVWWSKANTYKNAIANELFFALSAGIARRFPPDSSNRTFYADWAGRAVRWFLSSGMINSHNTINDGLVANTCTNNNGTTWTYNQGVILGGLSDLYLLDGNVSHLRLAVAIYTAATDALTTEGILHEPCEPSCGQDGCQFKGIFVRNTMYLLKTLTALQQNVTEFAAALRAMKHFIEVNADSICEKDAAAGGGKLGLVWSGPFVNASAGACTTGSGLDGLVARRALAKM
jgi:predicted alpha-1,6-mannanase (GH76 family)